MSDGFRANFGHKFKDTTASIFLLPLNPNRRKIEAIVSDFQEIVLF